MNEEIRKWAISLLSFSFNQVEQVFWRFQSSAKLIAIVFFFSCSMDNCYYLFFYEWMSETSISNYVENYYYFSSNYTNYISTLRVSDSNENIPCMSKKRSWSYPKTGSIDQFLLLLLSAFFFWKFKFEERKKTNNGQLFIDRFVLIEIVVIQLIIIAKMFTARVHYPELWHRSSGHLLQLQMHSSAPPLRLWVGTISPTRNHPNPSYAKKKPHRWISYFERRLYNIK